MPRLNEAERNQILGMLINSRLKDVCERFNVSKQAVINLKNKVQQTGSVKDRQRSGRPKVTNEVDDRRIYLNHLRNRFLTAADTGRNLEISRQTVVRRLKNNGLKSRRPVRRPVLTDINKRLRLTWATAHKRWTLRQWEDVIFSDESPFPIESHDARERVYRRQGENFSDCCVSTASKKQKVMVWGAISALRKSPLIIIRGSLTAERYINEILNPVLLPFINEHRGRNITFQQDGATPHTAYVTRDFLADNNVSVLPWPAVSPDMNPIEHVWDMMKRSIRKLNPRPRTVPQMECAVRNVWNNIQQRDLKTLCLSMRRRCTAAVNAGGSHTRY